MASTSRPIDEQADLYASSALEELWSRRTLVLTDLRPARMVSSISTDFWKQPMSHNIDRAIIASLSLCKKKGAKRKPS